MIDFGLCTGSGRFSAQLQQSLEGDLRQSTTACSSILLERVLKSGCSLEGTNNISGHSFWISMECCRSSLKQWRATFDADASSLGLLFDIYEDVLNAIFALHAAGITHYDLKADNVFLRTDPMKEGGRDCVCIGDYGEACVIPGIPASSVFHSGRARGTECIKAPEMLLRGVAGDTSMKGTNASSDIWGLVSLKGGENTNPTCKCN